MKFGAPMAAFVLLGLLLGRDVAVSRAGPASDAPPSSGATGSDTLRLTLAACVDRALAGGEEMRQAASTRAVAHARYLQARSTALPKVSLSTVYTRQIQSIFGGSGGGATTFEPDTNAALEIRVRDLEKSLPNSGFYAVSQLLSSSSFASKNSWNAALDVRQKITQGGSTWGSIAAAGHALDASVMLEEDKRAEVMLNVRRAYLNALLADRGVRIGELGLEQAASHLQRVKLRQESGSASEFELLQAEVEQDNQIPAVKQARSVQEAAYLELRRLCNLPKDAPIDLETPLLESAAIPADPAAVDTTGLIDSAWRASGVSALENVLAAREHAITVAAAGRHPELSAFADLSQQAYPAATFPTRDSWRRSVSAGLSLSWNIFDGLQTKGAIEEARANANSARADLATARELVRNAVIQGRFELERSAADLHARSRTVELAKRALELANLRYDEGASSLLEVTDVRIAWQMAQTNEALARRDYFAALALLERYTDRPLFSTHVPDATVR
jgi:outer membrane protein